jgi:replicative DNA helicase
MTEYVPEPEILFPYDAAPSSALYNAEAEEAVVACVLVSEGEVLPDVREILAPEDFYLFQTRAIYKAFFELQESGIGFDLLTVSDHLGKMGVLGEIGGPAYITRLLGFGGGVYSAISYARIVESYSVRRKLIASANEIAKAAYELDKPIEDVLAMAAKHNPNEIEFTEKDETEDSDEAALALLEMVMRNTPTGVKSGFPYFDGYDGLGGFPVGATLLLGDSSFGKSAWCLQICEQAAFSGRTALYMGLESTNEAMVVRRVASAAGVTSKAIRTGTLTQQEQDRLRDKIVNDYQGKYHGRLKFNSRATTLRAVERAIRRHRPAIAVVDQITQIEDAPSTNPTQNMLRNFAELKRIANKYDCALIVVHAITAEESRAFFERNQKAITQNKAQKNLMPDINAIPWASQMKFLADAILFLVPEVNQNLVKATLLRIFIWIMKDRDGQRFAPTRWEYNTIMQWWKDLPSRSTAQVPSTP